MPGISEQKRRVRLAGGHCERRLEQLLDVMENVRAMPSREALI
jgi:hypothetical protein